MNFIKSIWNKVKSFFGNLFGSKKVAAVAAPTAVAPAAKTASPVEVAAAQEADVAAKAAAAERMEKLAIIFNRIAEAASYRNYSLAEARAAFHADDEATLVRIERQMKNRTYKAPKKVKAKAAVAA